MPEKIEIIYDFNGYADPGIKNVELSRVNGYKTIITKEGEEIMKEGKEIMTEEYRLKNLGGADARRIIECADQKDINVDKIIEFINKLKGGEKMTEEKMTEEEYLKKEGKNLEKIEKYISENPGTEYRDAVLAVSDKDELSENEQKVEEYIQKCKSQGIEVTYRQAVLKVLDRSEPEETGKKEE